MMVQLERRLWTAAEYHRLAEVGILHEDDRVELVRGEILVKSPVSVRHIGCVNLLTRLLTFQLNSRAVISVNNPVRLDELSEPDVDVALVVYREDFYASRAATAEDVQSISAVAFPDVTFQVADLIR